MIKGAALALAVAVSLSSMPGCSRSQPPAGGDAPPAATTAAARPAPQQPAAAAAVESTAEPVPAAHEAGSHETTNELGIDAQPAGQLADQTRPLNLSSSETGDLLSGGPPSPGGEPVEVDPQIFPVKIEPAELDLGAIPLGEQGRGTITLVNRGDATVTLSECKRACGCTAVNCPTGRSLAPGEKVDIEISLQAGLVPGKRPSLTQRKRVSFIFEGNQSLSMDVKGETVAYVEPDPLYLDPNRNTEGRLVLRSRDGAAFRVTAMEPALIEASALPAESQAEHVLFIDWKRWEELGKEKKLFFTVDHAQMQRVIANVRPTTVRPPSAAAEERDREREVKPDETPGAGRLPYRALERALEGGRFDAIRERIEGGRIDAHVKSESGATLLDLAARYGSPEIAQALIDKKVDVNAADAAGHSPLMTAVQHRKLDVARVLLDAGASLEPLDSVGSALSWAGGFGDEAGTRMLLEAGARVDVRGEATGYTPLIWAAAFGQSGSVQALVAAGANLEAADIAQGATALMHAVRVGSADKARILLEAGSPPNGRDSQGRTALLIAADSAAAGADVLQVLVAGGADIRATDPSGRNALDLALDRKDPRAAAVREFLEARLVADVPKRVDDD